MFNDRCPFDPINVHHFHVVRWVKRRKWIPARPPARPCHYFLFSSSSSSFFYLITCNKYIACLPSCFCIYECVTEYLLNYQILFFFGLSLFPRTGEEEKETKNQIIIFLLRPGSSYATSAFYWSVSEEEIQGSWRLAMRNNNSQISGRSNKKKKTFTFFFSSSSSLLSSSSSWVSRKRTKRCASSSAWLRRPRRFVQVAATRVFKQFLYSRAVIQGYFYWCLQIAVHFQTSHFSSSSSFWFCPMTRIDHRCASLNSKKNKITTTRRVVLR